MNQRARICLVDDDALVRDAMSFGLQDAGYDVLNAADAAAALVMLAREPCAALVTDINLPGVSGAQLIGELKARWPELPIVAISGASHINGVSIAEAVEAVGADAVLQKPFRARELRAVLETLLKKA